MGRATDKFALPNFSLELGPQTALVTGASSGLGLRFAKVLASCGAKVALAARREDRLMDLAAEIKDSGGVASAFALDIADLKSMPAVLDEIEERFGCVSILINNAGMPDGDHVTRLSLDKINSVLDTNLRGAFVLSTEVARRLMDARLSGRIVNVSSMMAYEYFGGGAALYAITKSAIVRMTEVLAVEWARFNINVNGIAPGLFASEMTTGMLDRIGEPIYKDFPRERMGDPAQLDSALLFLVSPSSDFVTGTVIKVHDGQSGR